MDKREQIAAMALQGMMHKHSTHCPEYVAGLAVIFADALIERLDNDKFMELSGMRGNEQISEALNE